MANNHRGTVYLRGKTWTIGFTANGRRLREGIGPNKRMAEMVLAKRITAVMEGTYFPQKVVLGRMPFHEFADLYLERVVPLMKSARTEKTRVLRWIRHFRNRPLGQITRSEMEDWRRKRLATCRPATINRDLARLRNMFNRAVEWDLLEESPLQGLKFLRENNARTRYLKLEECDRLAKACTSVLTHAAVTLALHTGMRLGEILNLRWCDIDWSSGLLLIPDSKNGEPRHIPMDRAVRELLNDLDRRPGVDWVLTNARGEQLRDIRGGFRNALRRAGLTDLRFHDLRHTFASQWVQNGGDLYILKDILGHKSITITQRYAHLSPAYKRDAVNRMDNIWMGSAVSALGSVEGVPEMFSVTVASQGTVGIPPGVAETLQ